MSTYRDWFKEAARYALPDGTYVQSLWSDGAFVRDGGGSWWAFVSEAFGIFQYNVFADGRVIMTEYIVGGMIRTWLTDLSPEDFRLAS